MEKVEQIKNRIEAILKYKYNYDYNTVNSIMNNIELLGGFEPKFLSVVEEKAIKIMEITGQQDTFYENVLLVITQQKFFNGLNKDRKAINTNILNSENIGKVLDNIIKMSDFIKAKPLNNCPDKVAIFGSDGKIMELEILYFINEIKRLNIKNKPILATILTGDRKIFTNDLTNELIFSATDYNEILKLNKLTIEQRVYVEYCKNINKNFDEFKRDFLNATEYNVACILIENLKKDRKIPHNIDLRVFYANKKELNQSHTTTEDTVKEFLKLHPNCKTFVSTQPFADRQKKNAEIAKKN